jgi:hypothetical protein
MSQRSLYSIMRSFATFLRHPFDTHSQSPSWSSISPIPPKRTTSYSMKQARQQRRAKKAAPAPPAPKYTPPIRYARLQVLQNVARAQHLTSEPNAQLPDDVKDNLQEEWWQMVDEAMKILDPRLTCKVCGRIHEAQEATKIAEVLGLRWIRQMWKRSKRT